MFEHVDSKQSAPVKMTILSLLVAVLLSGCGIRGGLKTPPPVFGGDSKVDPERVPDQDLDKTKDDDDDFYLDDLSEDF